MCHIPLAPAAVLQTVQPLSVRGNDFGPTLTCPFCGGGSNVSDSKPGEQEKQIKGRGRKPSLHLGKCPCFDLAVTPES